MKGAADSWAVKVGIVAFLTLAVFVSVVRPLTRPAGNLYARFGLTRMSLLTESADDDDAPVRPPTNPTRQLLQPLLVVALLLLALKTHGTSFQPVRVRRVKRPPRRPANSLPADQR